MTLKIEVNNKHSKYDDTFPKLFISKDTDGLILLVSSILDDTYLEGTVLSKGKTTYLIGLHFNNMHADQFRPFNGSVTLTNGD